MKAHSRPRTTAAIDINHLRHGKTYEARTTGGLVTIGEYLGIEVAHGDRLILLRGQTGTQSVAISRLESVLAASA